MTICISTNKNSGLILKPYSVSPISCFSGSGIFISPKGVLTETGSVGLSLIVWVGSGILSLFGEVTFSHSRVVFFYQYNYCAH